MLNEIGCLRWDWTAIGAIATAAASIVAFGVWWDSKIAVQRALHKKLMVARELMSEELTRVTSKSVELAEISSSGIGHLVKHNFGNNLSNKLETPHAKFLIDQLEYFPLKVGVETAKFVAQTSFLKSLLEEGLTNQKNLQDRPHLENFSLALYYQESLRDQSRVVLRHAISLAETWDMEQKKGSGDLKIRIEGIVYTGKDAGWVDEDWWKREYVGEGDSQSPEASKL